MKTSAVQHPQHMSLNRPNGSKEFQVRLPSVLHGCAGVWGPEQLETCIYPRAAERRGDPFRLIFLCCLVWLAGLGSVPCQEGTGRKCWTTNPLHLSPGTDRAGSMHASFFFFFYLSSALVNLVNAPVADAAERSFSGIYFWQDLSLNQTCQPHILGSMWLSIPDCSYSSWTPLSSAHGSIWF